MRVFSAVFLTMIVMIVPDMLFAQPGLPGSPSQVPIDGGLGLLAAAGGMYAARKLLKRAGEDDSLND